MVSQLIVCFARSRRGLQRVHRVFGELTVAVLRTRTRSHNFQSRIRLHLWCHRPLYPHRAAAATAGQVFVVPAVPFLGWRATPIPLVWGAAAGLVAVGVSLRAPETLNTVLCGAAIALAGYVHMQSSGDPLPAQAR